MKTNFNSKLFEKQIDLKSCNTVMGGDTGCHQAVFSYEGGQHVDTTTTYYNEQGQPIEAMTCQHR